MSYCAAVQVVLVSATLPHEILEMTNKFMTDPVRILVKRDELTLEVRGGGQVLSPPVSMGVGVSALAWTGM